MKIAIEGCAHGELDTIYDTIKLLQEQEEIEIDLLICCGDFQATRNEHDMESMAIPKKYRDLCTFYKYYNGEKIAPILTIFVGGNHEASNYLQELPYGGWVAPNIYYLGYAGVINIAGVRIGGLSGIYKYHDYMKGHYEIPPYNEHSIRSVYHVRNLEIFRLKQLSDNIDIFISHDWPTGITEYGNVKQLVKFKPHFQNDIQSGKLGNPQTEALLKQLKPSYWFSAHLHCKFAALIPHSDTEVTKFLALDKCLPNRRFLQVLDVPHDSSLKISISYDLEWLAILYATNHLLSVKNTIQYMPGPNGTERFNFTPTDKEKELILTKFENNLVVPLNFEQTAPGYSDIISDISKLEDVRLNSQTQLFCRKLCIDDPIERILQNKSSSISINTSYTVDLNTTSFINDSDVFDAEYDSTFDSSSIVNRSLKMNLPEPKCVEELDINDSNIELNTSGDVQLVEAECDSISEKNVKTEDNVTPVKKFKRRNADMYTNVDHSFPQ